MAPANSRSDDLGVAASMDGGLRLLLLRTSQYFFFFLGGIIVARALGPELRGQYSLALALGLLAWAFVNLSLDTASGRLLGRQEATLVEVARALSTATLVLGGIGGLATLLVGFAVRDTLLAGASTAAVMLAALLVPVTLAVQVLTGLLVRVGALRIYGWAAATCASLVLIVNIVLAAADRVTPASAIAAILGGAVLLTVVLAAALSRHTGVRGLLPGLDRRVALKLVRAGGALHLAGLVLFCNLRIDLFLVSALTHGTGAGLYSLSATLAEIIFLASLTIAQAAAQTQTEAEPKIAARYTLEFLRQTWPLVAVAAVLAAVVAWPAIVLIYGRTWEGSVLPFAILSLGAVAFTLEAPVRTLLARLARPSVILAPAFAGLVINVGLNLALIPLLGITGAALASLASYWAYALMLLARFAHITEQPFGAIFARPRADDPAARYWRAMTSRSPHR